MALEEICGITNETASRRSGAPDFERYLKEYCSNLDNPYCLSAPPFKNPMESMQKFVSDGACGGIKINYDHGTTTLGFKFQGGVVLAVDSRATGGQFIGSQSVRKVVEINKHLLATMAGGAADCIYWDRVLARECRLYELRNKDRISVAASSKIMANIAFGYKGTGLSMGMMLAGFDKRGPGLYYVDSDGSRSPGNVFSVGSGSIYALGVLDTTYKWDLKDEEAFELGRRAIYHATYRDSYSGGIVRVYHMTANGWVNISNTDCMDLHYKYEAENKAAEEVDL